jgi:hypothetical protein
VEVSLAHSLAKCEDGGHRKSFKCSRRVVLNLSKINHDCHSSSNVSTQFEPCALPCSVSYASSSHLKALWPASFWAQDLITKALLILRTCPEMPYPTVKVSSKENCNFRLSFAGISCTNQGQNLDFNNVLEQLILFSSNCMI